MTILRDVATIQRYQYHPKATKLEVVADLLAYKTTWLDIGSCDNDDVWHKAYKALLKSRIVKFEKGTTVSVDMHTAQVFIDDWMQENYWNSSEYFHIYKPFGKDNN